MIRSTALNASKNPSSIVALKSALRSLLVYCPLKVLFYCVELCCRSVDKSYVVFFLPYNENCDNVRALYSHLDGLKDNRRKPIIFSFCNEYVKQLEKVYGCRNVIYARSMRAARVFIRAHTIVMNRGAISTSIFPYSVLRKYKRFINLGYGSPLKRVGRLSAYNFEKVFRFERLKYSEWIASSEIEKLSLLACYGFEYSEVKVTGMPRNDVLIKNSTTKMVGTRRMILYAPTWRGGMNAEVLPFNDLDPACLNEWLELQNLELLIRPHVVDGTVGIGRLEAGSRIIVDDRVDPWNSLASTMSRSSILVTDYSSIYLDYLLLDKPIVFAPYDIEDYIRKRGFLYDYHNHTPGPKVGTMFEFMSAVDDALDNPNRYRIQRKIIRDKFHEHQDGLACSRVTDLITVPT